MVIQEGEMEEAGAMGGGELLLGDKDVDFFKLGGGDGFDVVG